MALAQLTHLTFMPEILQIDLISLSIALVRSSLKYILKAFTNSTKLSFPESDSFTVRFMNYIFVSKSDAMTTLIFYNPFSHSSIMHFNIVDIPCNALFASYLFMFIRNMLVGLT